MQNLIKHTLAILTCIFILSLAVNIKAFSGNSATWQTSFKVSRETEKTDIYKYEDEDAICYTATTDVYHGTSTSISCIKKESER